MVSPISPRLSTYAHSYPAVVVGRGKTGWNKLLGKLAVTKANKTAEGTNLREKDKNDEQRWAEQVASEARKVKGKGREEDEDDEQEEPAHEGATHGMFAGAGKFLLAGGVAGAGESRRLSRWTQYSCVLQSRGRLQHRSTD
jgi:hypothetical protein